MMSYDYPHPVSKTYQYKKVTKPLLERKRRARINKCLDELKNLMIDALETEGEDISKLEKADILELTVRHLQRLQSLQSSGLTSAITKNDELSAESRWLSGFGHCAAEAYKFLSALPGEGAERLARHLAAGLQKSRQTNSSAKTSVLPFLVELAAVNSTVQESRLTSSNKTVASSCEQNLDAASFNISSQYSSPHSTDTDEKSNSSCVSQAKELEEKQTVTKVKAEVRVEDDEEIDVEHVDKVDPMWRPW
ncbi:enhancer of split mgamma protein [Calliopsis andreniformis]|uniref:enhancer of split mgamma protein n=1 Tax=Calliopsis andreniformis TaxID=337506 RepID=UPI003FCE2349